LAILSISNMYLAVLADVGTTLIAILNSLRLWGKYKKGK
jgi:cation transport ATPase